MNIDKKTVKIAVLSDLHVGNNDHNSYLTVGTHDTPQENPFEALKEFTKSESIDADILICCGDMADQADTAGQMYAWNHIHDLSNTLKVEKIFGTVGNHDMLSRGDSYDPKGSLQKLMPYFPNEDENYCDRYWARNFAFSEFGENVRLLNINSCTFHGYGNKDLKEYEHGRISQFTIDKIESHLKGYVSKGKEYNVNIAFFHHHPIKWNHRSIDDYSEMDGGDQLLQLLSKSEYGNWIIIHGHRHWPNIQIAPSSGSNPPIIFSAGSFSSKRLVIEGGSAQNQFYIIEICTNPMDTHDLSIAGKIYAWNWAYGVGWREAPYPDGIPYGCGFTNSNTTAQILAKHIDEYGKQELFFSWDDLLQKMPILNFTLPKAIKEISTILETKYNYKISYDALHWPSQFSKQRDSEGDV